MKTIIVEIKISGNGILHFNQLPKLINAIAKKLPSGGKEVVVISGRLPVWAFCTIAHYFHPRPAIATFEPRLLKGVIIASHTDAYNIGDLIDITNAQKVQIIFP